SQASRLHWRTSATGQPMLCATAFFIWQYPSFTAFRRTSPNRFYHLCCCILLGIYLYLLYARAWFASIYALAVGRPFCYRLAQLFWHWRAQPPFSVWAGWPVPVAPPICHHPASAQFRRFSAGYVA